MSKVTLMSGEVVQAKIVKGTKYCPTDKMAVWRDEAGRCTTAVIKISRGTYREVV